MLVHLTNRFQGRTFLEIGQPETRIAYDGLVFKGTEAVRIEFVFILKVANIRCFILVEMFNNIIRK